MYECMKRILIMCLCIFVVFTSIAQNIKEQQDSILKHLEFKGIEINGNIDTFIQKLEDEGFVYKQKVRDDLLTIMEGEFIGKKCVLIIACSPKTKITSKVSVLLEKSESWTSLKVAYNYYKELFSKKYGTSKSFEFFSKPYYEGDGYELQAIRKDKCTYISRWETKRGTISVGIASTNAIIIDYEDKINSKKASEEQDKKILDEI